MGLEISLYQDLSLKIGETTNSRKKYPTARLQKGFLLLDHGVELAEEAVGFGVPVLKRGLQTIFPGDAALAWERNGSRQEITARFQLNLIEKISGRGNKNLEYGWIYSLKNFLADIIRRVPKSRDLLTAISSGMRRMFSWETTYADAGTVNEVKVIYSLERETGKVVVEINVRDMPPDISEVVMMNEQGAHFFDRYLDSTGLSLQGKEIGCWDEVVAEEAWFESSTHHVSFKLSPVNGARLFRGRELIGSRVAWAGFGYSFPPSLQKLRYELKIERPA